MRFLLILIFTIVFHLNGWSQIDSIYLIDEDFNLPPQLDINYHSVGMSMEFNENKLLNGSFVIKTNVSNARLDFYGVPIQNCDSLKMSIWSRTDVISSNSGIDHILSMSLDSTTFYPLAGFGTVSSSWEEYSYTWINPFDEYPVDTIWFKLAVDSYGSYWTYIEDFSALCYMSEPAIEEPVLCDTVYVEQPPIVIYETDIPQECLLDSDGDGAINVSDLMNLLLNFGNSAPCLILNPN